MQLGTIGQFQMISGRAQMALQSDVAAPDVDDSAVLSGAAPTAKTAAATDPDPINTAALAAAKLAVAEQKAWIESNFRRTSGDLAATLPDADKAQLQALVDDGDMTWDDINAALDARIKQATNSLLTEQGDTLNQMPASWQASQDAWGAYQSWNTAARDGKTAIYARYGEKFAEVMANDPGPTEGTDTDPQALAKLLAREGVLDRYRQVMNREIADLEERLGAQPPRPTTLPVGFNPYEMAQFEARLTSADTVAVAKLDAAGFTGSAALDDAVGRLAGEIAQNIAKTLNR